MALIGICRIGDTASGTCTAHSSPRAWVGTLQTSSTGFTADGIGVCGVGDTGTTDCGHTFQITAGSTVLTGAGIAVARIGDPVIVIQGGNGVLTSGSTIVKSE